MNYYLKTVYFIRGVALKLVIVTNSKLPRYYFKWFASCWVYFYINWACFVQIIEGNSNYFQIMVVEFDFMLVKIISISSDSKSNLGRQHHRIFDMLDFQCVRST